MNRLDLSGVAYISEETHESMAWSQLWPGDILLNITGASIGRVTVVPSELNEANVNQHVCRIRLREGANPHYRRAWSDGIRSSSALCGSEVRRSAARCEGAARVEGSDEGLAPFAARLMPVLEGKLNRHLCDGRIVGYGKVFFPK